MHHSNKLSLAQALHQHYRKNQRWGFLWAVWTAILWGAWYVPGTAMWFTHPFVDIGANDASLRLAATAVVTFIHAIAVFGFLTLWNAVLGKLPDFARTLVRVRTISKWYALASLAGGPMAIFGSYMAMGYVGPVFAALTSLFYPVVGAVIAALWYQEKITRRAAIGMAIIISGGIAIFGPGLSGEFSLVHHHAWLGYLGGVMSALGWGAEGAIAARAMDVSDPDVGLQCRFSFEILFWGLLILPALALCTSLPVGHLLLAAVSNGTCMLWVVIAAACHAYCYTSFYKSFTLIGVGRGEAVGNLYGVFALLFIAVFTLQLPPWYFLVGLACAVIGSFVMFGESAETVARLRNHDSTAEEGI